MIKTINRLSQKQRDELKSGVIQVTGKAMNRTALGVVAAVFEMFPSITFKELKELLPDSINPSAPKNYKSIFKPYTDRLYGVVQPGSIREECATQGLDVASSHFTGADEVFRTSDGVEVLVSRSWESSDTETGSHDLQNLIDHAKNFGIHVVQVEKKEAFNRGDYHLEIINAPLLEEIRKPKSDRKWLWLLLLLALVALLLWYFNSNKKEEPLPVAAPSQPVEIKKDTVAAETLSQIDELKKDIASGENTESRSLTFNDILFSVNSDKILPSSDSILTETFDLLKEFSDLNVEIVGHTSEEGNESYNQRLSEKRAIAVKKHLVTKGIPTDRIKTRGEGIKKPIADNDSEEGRAKNRRIEFIVLKDGNPNS